jgi:DNA-binding YbaB/EbfC family protein
MFGAGSGGDGMPDLEGLLQQASAMQERLVAAQRELEDARVEGTAGGGLVHATVTGTGELVGLTIDPSVCDPADPETLADLVVAAVQNAVESAHRVAADAMGGLAGGFGDDDVGAEPGARGETGGNGIGFGGSLGGAFGGLPPSTLPGDDQG